MSKKSDWLQLIRIHGYIIPIAPADTEQTTRHEVAEVILDQPSCQLTARHISTLRRNQQKPAYIRRIA